MKLEIDLIAITMNLISAFYHVHASPEYFVFEKQMGICPLPKVHITLSSQKPFQKE